MRKVIKNGLVITMDEERELLIEKLDIVIDDNKITQVLKDYSGSYDYIIDASNKIVMPGLINAHTHLGMSIFRATNDSLTLDKWLKEYIWPIEDNMNDEDTYYTTLISCYEMIKTGTTTCNDMYFYCDGVIKALKEAKVRCLFSRSITDNDGLGDKRFQEFLDIYKEHKDDNLFSFAVAPHAMYTCSKDYLKECSNFAKKENLRVHIHFCENDNEVEGIKNDYHKNPVQALQEVGLLDNKLILAHGTFICEDELKLLQDKDVSIVHNPVSNLNLGCGIADISLYKKYVNVCLGTDSQGSGNNLNMFYHMSLVDLLQKGLHKDPTIIDSYEVLKMATINGAKALGINDIGVIKEGYKADIIIIDMNNLEVYPSIEIINNIVHNGYLNCVDTTIIDGNILYENKKFKINFNIEEIKSKTDKIIERVM